MTRNVCIGSLTDAVSSHTNAYLRLMFWMMHVVMVPVNSWGEGGIECFQHKNTLKSVLRIDLI